MADDDAFLQQLRAIFMVEAREHTQALSSGLLQLERQSAPAARAEIMESVFRAAHSLKGAARAVELTDIESICQSLEDVFAPLRRGRGGVALPAMDALHAALDAIEAILAGLGEAGAEPRAPADLRALRRELRQLAVRMGGQASAEPAAPPPPAPADAGEPDAAAPPVDLARTRARAAGAGAGRALQGGDASAAASQETVRVPVSKLEAQLLDTEELLMAKLAAAQRTGDLRALSGWFREWRQARVAIAGWAMAQRQAPDPAQQRVLAFYDWSDEAVRALEARFAEIGRNAQHDHDEIEKSLDQLLGSAKRLLLLPFSTVSASFQKLVRDLCRAEGKEADLFISGDTVEVDKRILEELKDPLIHMLRNAVDHAVEPPAERVRAGKPARASISLSVSRTDGNQVLIVLADDGRGIQAGQVGEAAMARGIVSREQLAGMDEAERQALVFQSEVSTGQAVTRLSGRGLGLAIVQESVRRLGGTVRLQSRAGEGTTFTLALPGVRATFRGILCEAGGQALLMPITRVERVLRVPADSVQTAEGREFITLDGRAVALVRLAEVLELESPAAGSAAAGEDIQCVLVDGGGQTLAFGVDAVVEEQEVLVKPLRRPLVRVRNISAAAVLGSGALVPILNVADLLLSARGVVGGVRRGAAAARAAPAGARSILVAEDSITSRMLLKTILEAAGFQVKTAVDGMEAFALLRAGAFDMLVSDVEMPRLNGFDLTARVRADRRLSDLPVVLVTALATPADRERGMDVGANAYVAKGTFDQDDLVEIVRRLI